MTHHGECLERDIFGKNGTHLLVNLGMGSAQVC